MGRSRRERGAAPSPQNMTNIWNHNENDTKSVILIKWLHFCHTLIPVMCCILACFLYLSALNTYPLLPSRPICDRCLKGQAQYPRSTIPKKPPRSCLPFFACRPNYSIRLKVIESKIEDQRTTQCTTLERALCCTILSDHTKNYPVWISCKHHW